jgi:ATP-binding cassette subfamily B protein
MIPLIRLILFLPRKYVFYSCLIILSALLLSLSEVFVLSSIKPFIQSFSSIDKSVDLENSFEYASKFLFTVIICGLLRVFLLFTQYRIAASISAKISSFAFQKIINQEYIFLKSANQSKFLSILIQDVPRNSEALSNFASLVSNTIILISISFSLLFLETKLFLISGLFISLVYLIIILLFAKKLKINGENITKYNHEQAGLVRSTLASIVDLIIGRSSEKQIKKFISNEIKSRNSYANTLIYSQSPRYIVETVCLCLFTFFIIISISNNSSLLIFGQLGTLLFAFNRILPASQQTYSAYAFIKSSSLSINNLIFLFSLKTKKTKKLSNYFVNEIIKNDFLYKNEKNKIKIKNLKYQYKDNHEIIYDDWEFVEGQPTAILGKSGSGKTTLVELILKLLTPTEGEIELNNLNIKNIPNTYFYKNISYLSQSPFLFTGTLYENILFGSNELISKRELYENGIKLGLKEEFGSHFLDYMISDFGRNISGGQAQRISLLKIISSVKPIIILDEPSSSLDLKTSMIFNDLLLSKTKNSIVIVITHSEVQSNLFPMRFKLK